MLTCPTCRKSYSGDERHCPLDGTTLLPHDVVRGMPEAAMDLQAGTAVGEYVIEAKIGAGGFGDVYRARHPLIGKSAAVKVLSREFSSNVEIVSRFVAEARVVNQIRHQNIIDIFAFGSLPDGRQYYIMELLEGMPLDAYLSIHGKLSLEVAMPILRDVARALDAAHQKNIVHRDLKPENIFLSNVGEGQVVPKLLDFGIAKVGEGATHKTKSGVVMGTAYYMSPEQCRGKNVDARSDVYSLGCVVFELLAGAVPFAGESHADVIIKHMSEPVPSLSARVPGISPQFDVALAALMAKDPNQRPASAGAAFDSLFAVASASGVTLANSGSIAMALSSRDPSQPRPVAFATTVTPQRYEDLVRPGSSPRIEAVSANVPMQSARVIRSSPPSKVLWFLLPVAFLAVFFLAWRAWSTSQGHITVKVDPVPTASTAAVTVPSAPPIASTGGEATTALAAPQEPVRIRFTHAPKGASVWHGTERIGLAEQGVSGPKGSKQSVEVRAQGYASRKLEIAFLRDGEIDAALKPLQVSVKPAGKRGELPDGIGN
jgi:eukaryotic-like serine/threonine-protein kinase